MSDSTTQNATEQALLISSLQEQLAQSQREAARLDRQVEAWAKASSDTLYKLQNKSFALKEALEINLLMVAELTRLQGSPYTVPSLYADFGPEEYVPRAQFKSN